MKNLDDLLQEYGSVTKLAKHLGVSRQVVHKWKRNGYITEQSAWMIQAKTGGRFNAEKYLRGRV